MVIARARAAGVKGFVEVGYDVTTSERSVALAGEEPDIWAAVGVHPHEVARAGEDAFERVRSLAAARRVVAIGECGLDFYRNLSPPDLQREWFERQLSLAREAGLPVVDERIPFPGSGQQRKFELAFAKALKARPVRGRP